MYLGSRSSNKGGGARVLQLMSKHRMIIYIDRGLLNLAQLLLITILDLFTVLPSSESEENCVIDYCVDTALLQVATTDSTFILDLLDRMNDEVSSQRKFEMIFSFE